MLSFRVATVLWAVLAPMAAGYGTYLAMLGREYMVVNGAVAAARKDETVTCNARVATIEKFQNDAVDAAVDASIARGSGQAPILNSKAAIIEACESSEACRSKGAK